MKTSKLLAIAFSLMLSSCNLLETPNNHTPVIMSVSSVTATTATLSGHLDIPAYDVPYTEVTIYYADTESLNINTAESVVINEFDSNQNFTLYLDNLEFNTIYSYCVIADIKSNKTYSETLHFTTGNISIELTSREDQILSTLPRTYFIGSVKGLTEEDMGLIEIGCAYSTVKEKLQTWESTKISPNRIESDGKFDIYSDILNVSFTYYYCPYVMQNQRYIYGDIKEFKTINPYEARFDLDASSAIDLSSTGSANCYIVSEGGLYKFRAVEGNTSSYVSNIDNASLVWEIFGHWSANEAFDLIDSVCYKDGYIVFKTADSYCEGNALIAAKDKKGTILWSWHIWLTEQPTGQVYYNDAGTMMDRNLGAINAFEPFHPGLLYQWGRKDPFPAYQEVRSQTSSILWSSEVDLNSETGTIAYTIANPTTFIKDSHSSIDTPFSKSRTLWTTSDKTKSVYDPCPYGWRVPDGGIDGVWHKATGEDNFSTNFGSGCNFSGIFGDDENIWYRAAGQRNGNSGEYELDSDVGLYWSASFTSDDYPSCLMMYGGGIFTAYIGSRFNGYSVRCIKDK